MMKSDVKEETSDGAWRVDEENESDYNFSDEKGLWQPKPADILLMFEQLSKGSGLPLQLQWTCPGRRAPSPQHEMDISEETGMEVDQQQTNEQIQEPEPCAFDFDDSQSDGGVRATTPMRALGGPARTPRTEKRVARMDNIMDSLRKQQMQRAAEREARRAKASPGRAAQGRGRLLKFGSPPAQHRSPKSTESSDIKMAAVTSKSSEAGKDDPFAFSHKVTNDGKTPVSHTAEASTTAASMVTTSVTDSGNVSTSTAVEEHVKENVSAANNILQREDVAPLDTPDEKVELSDGKCNVSADVQQTQTDNTVGINSSSLQPPGPKDTIVCGENQNASLDTPVAAETGYSLLPTSSLTTPSTIPGSTPADNTTKSAESPSLSLSGTNNNTNQAQVTVSSTATFPSTSVEVASTTSTSVVTSDSTNMPAPAASDISLQPVPSDTSDPC